MCAVDGSRQSPRRLFHRGDWRGLILYSVVIAVLHVVGWGTLVLFVAPLYPTALGLGAGVTVYLLGLRHAFDADHISAIDNTTRKLMADGQRPLGVGFFFALGHSLVVLLMTLGVAFAVRAVADVTGEGSHWRLVGGLVATGVSATFLYLIGILNLVILLGIIRVFRAMRHGAYDELSLEEQLQRRGIMNRLLGPLARSVRASWQMAPVGFLFGLGFDTASEVALLAVAASAASTGLPFYAVVCLPVLFAAGMAMMDTADGAFMALAYGWAFSSPVRKIYYNLTVTGLSVGVAFLVGTIELLALAQSHFKLSGRFWDSIGDLDLGTIGYAIVGLFVATWLGAYLVWKLGRVEERWSTT